MPRQVDNHATEERRTEVAKLLATGLLRFRRRVLTPSLGDGPERSTS